MDIKGIIELISNKPWVIFIVLSLGFGYAYWDQSSNMQKLQREIGGLHAEMQKMHEIIKLKVELAQKECK